MRWISVAMVLAMSVAATGCDVRDALSGKAELTGKVKEVVDRTHTIRTTYALYYTNLSVDRQGVATTRWVAEFNDGVHHRVETATIRLVAECQAMTGGESVDDGSQPLMGAAAAKAACGIDANIPITDFAYLGVADTPWGRADRIRLSNDELSRIYEVNKDGVIVGENWYGATKGHPAVLKMSVLALAPNLPSPAMFDAGSLQTTFTPEQYKVAPK
jgi:hypothetical protein